MCSCRRDAITVTVYKCFGIVPRLVLTLAASPTGSAICVMRVAIRVVYIELRGIGFLCDNHWCLPDTVVCLAQLDQSYTAAMAAAGAEQRMRYYSMHSMPNSLLKCLPAGQHSIWTAVDDLPSFCNVRPGWPPLWPMHPPHEPLVGS
jgi:hypothetical protein